MEKYNVSKKKYINIILALLALTVMPIYLYGLRVLVLLVASIATAVVTDFICVRLSGNKTWSKYDGSFIITALITTLLLPASAPLWIPIVSTAIAITVAKYPFGGNGYNTFNPAAVGLSFVALCWPEHVLRYPAPFGTIGVTDPSLIQYAASPASILRVGGTPKIDYFDVFLGKFAGPMGATCMIVLAACMFYLVVRRVISLRIILSVLFVVGFFAVVFPRVSTGEWSSLFFEGSSGALIFGIIFMANDPVTIPKTKSGQILFGLILGALVVTFRHFGKVELEFVFAILIANIFAIPCDKYAFYISKKLDKLLPDEKFQKGKKNKNADTAIENEDVVSVERKGQDAKDVLSEA